MTILDIDQFINDNDPIEPEDLEEVPSTGIDGFIRPIFYTTDDPPQEILNLNAANLRVDDDAYILGNVGVGTTQPQQKLDVLGSVKIDENIYDSVNVPGRNGYQLSRDVNGIRWIPLIVDGASSCCGFGTIVGLSTYSEGLFILDEGVPLYPEQ